ncbi:hypothetical protein CYMTET_38583 [Cymbomonas tetramitiformis]|uniref:Uncharacterized protein n=1 Tax=Cymbomonas tetramitiformis TaxID=36881 RepID=A0AAE0CBQ7_9CHLO|nr:hypothetical protein CYMTET_38583 [Cymbomonas tetramitiformis]
MVSAAANQRGRSPLLRPLPIHSPSPPPSKRGIKLQRKSNPLPILPDRKGAPKDAPPLKPVNKRRLAEIPISEKGTAKQGSAAQRLGRPLARPNGVWSPPPDLAEPPNQHTARGKKIAEKQESTPEILGWDEAESQMRRTEGEMQLTDRSKLDKEKKEHRGFTKAKLSPYGRMDKATHRRVRLPKL